MKRLMLLAGVILVVGIVAAPAQGRVNARLSGDFQVTGKITSSNDGSTGSVRKRRYTFNPLCGRGVCRKVALRREGPNNRKFNSILKKRGTGFYRGVEKSRTGSGCRQTVNLRIRITKQNQGQATAFRGKARFRVEGCNRSRDNLRQRARLTGRKR